jgi:hypothetical protein
MHHRERRSCHNVMLGHSTELSTSGHHSFTSAASGSPPRRGFSARSSGGLSMQIIPINTVLHPHSSRLSILGSVSKHWRREKEEPPRRNQLGDARRREHERVISFQCERADGQHPAYSRTKASPVGSCTGWSSSRERGAASAPVLRLPSWTPNVGLRTPDSRCVASAAPTFRFSEDASRGERCEPTALASD